MSQQLRIGYSFWGFLGDHKLDDDLKELSTPDGNATYSWALIHEAQRRGHVVYQMQHDRDQPAIGKYGVDDFAAFSQEKRMNAWTYMRRPDGGRVTSFFPKLDVLLLEWRMPIEGRNCSKLEDGTLVFDTKVHQPDLERQRQLLYHYAAEGTKIIVWDLDHKLTKEDEEFWSAEIDAIFETSVQPRRLTMDRIRVEPPCLISDLLQFPTLPVDHSRKLVYVGSRYERDDVIDEWIKPVSDRFPNQVEFYGNWLNTIDQCRERWPNVKYHGRITTNGFRDAYGTAVACPLLAKRSYLETGFITPRPWEALLFGTLPIGLGTHRAVNEYVLPGMVASDADDMIDILDQLGHFGYNRDGLRRLNVEQLEFMDARHFVDKIEDVVSRT